MPILPPSKKVEKVWGTETWFVNNDKYCGKLLTILPGYKCSLHYHPIKDETFTVARGRVIVQWMAGPSNTVYTNTLLVEGQSFHVPPNTPHRFYSPDNAIAELIETSTPHSDDDVVRMEPSGLI